MNKRQVKKMISKRQEMKERLTRVEDGRTLSAICKKFGFTYDKQYKYITDSGEYENKIGSSALLYHRGDHYKLQYFSGCFYPYITKIEEVTTCK